MHINYGIIRSNGRYLIEQHFTIIDSLHKITPKIMQWKNSAQLLNNKPITQTDAVQRISY